MYNHSPLVNISLQTTSNVSYELTRYFQQKMNDLFHGFEFIRVYINDHMISTKGNWKDHVHKLKLNLNKLK